MCKVHRSSLAPFGAVCHYREHPAVFPKWGGFGHGTNYWLCVVFSRDYRRRYSGVPASFGNEVSWG
uniref:Uncharacterized protein n=1 Tax=Anguilla anguilla TaxID=7936 RepID=A0A0E9XQI4_ANGAN